jgi:hypothetical protein
VKKTKTIGKTEELADDQTTTMPTVPSATQPRLVICMLRLPIPINVSIAITGGIMKSEHFIMACGHNNNATILGTDKPVCAICGCKEVMKVQPDLTDRMAKCAECNAPPVPSSPSLAFFEYRPEKQFDLYYDGCHGWD